MAFQMNVNKLDNTQSEFGKQGWGYHSEAAQNNNYKGPFTVGQNYADPTGQAFTQATHILQGGFSGQSDPTTQYQDALRKAAMDRIGGLQNNAQQQKQMLSNDLEKGFANQAAILRRSAAGTGAGASLGYGRAASSMANDFQNNMAKGLLGVDNNVTNELGQLGGIGQGLFGQELANRQMQYGQAQDLANMYNQFGSGVELQRAGEQRADGAADTAARKAAQAAIWNEAGKHLSGQYGMQMMQAMGGTGGGAGALAMMSDQRLKTDIRSADSDIGDFLNSVSAQKFKYKNPQQYGRGDVYGVMAQDLEKTDVGASMVTNTPQGKVVDFAKGFGAIMAALAQINERLNKLESK